MLRTKSVHAPIDARRDGLRILAARFRGRGMPSDRYDVWMASLGPSEALLELIQREEITWAEFKRRYIEQLFADAAVDRGNKSIKNHGQKFTLRLIKRLAEREEVTLMCHCPDPEDRCHVGVLAAVIKSARV